MAASERLENVNPTIHRRLAEREISPDDEDDDVVDEIDAREIFDILSINCNAPFVIHANLFKQ